MKKQVKFSTWSTMLSASAIIVLLYVLKYTKDDMSYWCIAIELMLIVLVAVTLFYMPLSVMLDNDYVTVKRPICSKRIPLADITEVKLCPPTMAERPIFGSGGFMGYWGRFREKGLGKYFAYYGKASNCFLVTLRDGRKYMLGCDDAGEMVSAINSRLCVA